MSRCALVTGGARGIGLGISRALAGEGIDLAIFGRRGGSEVEAVLEELRGFGVRVVYVQGDIASGADRARALSEVTAALGPIHILVNNAGVAPKVRADILEASEESFEWVLRTNLQGPYFLTQAVARGMVRERAAAPEVAACIINISSISATVASTSRGEYCISKAGVSMATQLWAARLGEFGIPVYEVRPGVIRSDMTAGVQEKYDRLLAGGLCVQSRWGEPEDVGRAVAALARGDFAYSTGQVILVDGGLTLARL
ncbi:MAG: 3-ketoacyl-ACP reductase [Lentisphaerae bacterium]|nr:3-ketoacyl-ACP reductase [Lentisphaerota bacterium]